MSVIEEPTATSKKPTCPRCGSNDVVEFDLVPVRYQVETIDADGARTISTASSEVIVDGGKFEELRCRACDHNTTNPDEFYDPRPTCRTCDESYPDAGDGYDGECPTCADITAREEGES